MPATPLTFGGEESFAAPPERVFGLLTDLDRLATTIPDLVSSQRVDERTLECVVRPGFSFLRGTMRVTIRLVESTPPESASLGVVAKGIGAQLGIESRFQLAAEGAGTRLTWSAEVVELKGLVATVGRSLIAAAADQVIRDAWRRIREELDNRAGPAAE